MLEMILKEEKMRILLKTKTTKIFGLMMMMMKGLNADDEALQKILLLTPH